MSDNLPALPGPQTAEIIRFPLTKAIQNHGKPPPGCDSGRAGKSARRLADG
jgi:hypothetical protein